MDGRNKKQTGKKQTAKKKRKENYDKKLAIKGSLEDVLKIAFVGTDKNKFKKESVKMSKTKEKDVTVEQTISLLYAMTEKINAQLETIMEKEAEILSKLNSTSKGFEQEKIKKLLKEKKTGLKG